MSTGFRLVSPLSRSLPLDRNDGRSDGRAEAVRGSAGCVWRMSEAVKDSRKDRSVSEIETSLDMPARMEAKVKRVA